MPRMRFLHPRQSAIRLLCEGLMLGIASPLKAGGEFLPSADRRQRTYLRVAITLIGNDTYILMYYGQ